MSLTFESADSVSFRSIHRSRFYNPRICAKAHYTFDNGNVVIENPLGDKSWLSSDLPCNMSLKGTFTDPHVLNTSSFFFVAPGVSASGCSSLTTPGYDQDGTKMYPNADYPGPDTTLERNYYIGFFNTNLALDLNNDGIASTDLSSECPMATTRCMTSRPGNGSQRMLGHSSTEM